MEQEYLSVKQFAKKAGVTTQRIYQMMNKSLKSYCKVEDGKKYISAVGLKIFERAEMEKNSLQEVASNLPRPNFRSCNSENTAYNADFPKENNENAEENLQVLAKDLPRPNFRSCNSENTACNADFAKENNETTEEDLQGLAKDLPRPNFRSCNSKNTAYNADFPKENSEITEEDLQGLAKDLPRPKFRSCNPLKSNLQEESNPNEQITKETVHVLQEQLAIKDKQIDEKDKQIAELTAMLKNSQEQQAALVQALTAAQALAAADKHQLLLQAGQTTEQAVSDNIQTSENTKKGFFQRLFGK